MHDCSPRHPPPPAVQDGTVKYLLQLADGNCIETVLMRYKYGNTVCVSTQVGCAMGCRFCASTQAGRVRDLTAGEIAAEIYTAQKDTGERVSHIVLMGIGEPLHNFNNVMDFLEIISCPEGVNIGMRNISLSTCGLVPKIDELAKRHLQLTLSVSLHAPDNKTRSGMMPVNDAFPLEQLIPACRRYQKETGRRISFEYSMVRGVNDSSEMAQKLANLIKGMGAHVNLIPINPVDGSLILPPTMQCAPLPEGAGGTGRQRHGAPPSGYRHQRRLRPAAPARDAQGKMSLAPQRSSGKEPTRMKIAAITDIGSCRQENQDNYCAQQLAGGTAWGIVCDGMGGVNGGRIAARIATDTMQQYFARHMKALQPGMEKTFIMRGFDITNRAVYEKSTSDPEMQGMGTTGVCAYASRGMAHVVHAGDSRAYLFHAGGLRQITRDHSMVQQLVDSGQITREQAAVHPQKNLITRALGVSANIVPEYNRCEIEAGDILLLCTDGLTNMVADDDIAQVLREVPFLMQPAFW